ncbi:uncharacterized protein LOC143358380 [Halictus rubicundus]|uniref:uncharacterized protein LOC143358380 n=1 Tax=Halictus rubicundus TaxID=77578 RepID=UPI0040373F6A
MISHSRRSGNSKGHKRWLPCRAWDFESLMYPSVFLSKLFGFFPYEYKDGEYVISKIRLAFAAVMACFYLALQIYALYSINVLDSNYSIQETMGGNFFALLDGSIPILMFLTYYSRSFMLQRVSKVSRILSPQDFNDMTRFLHLTHILNFLFHLLYAPLLYAQELTVFLVRRCVYLVIATTSTEGVLFYLNCVCVLGSCFKKVNECLKRLKNCQSELTKEHLPRRQSAMLLRKVKYYEKMHENISDAVDQLNKSSCSVNITYTAGTIVVITFDLYSCMQWISNASELSSNGYLLFEYFSFVLLKFTRFTLLIWACETAMGHATEINTTMHDLANSCTDDTVKREVIGDRN